MSRTLMLMKYHRPSIKEVEMNITITDNTTTTYDIGEGFMVDVVFIPDEEAYEAWLYHKNYGRKTLIIGSPKHDFMDQEIDHEEFLKMVQTNLEGGEFVHDYVKEYFAGYNRKERMSM